MTTEEKPVSEPVYGRSLRDLLYEGRYRLAGIILVIVLWYFGIRRRLRERLGYLIGVPLGIGLVLGIAYGYVTRRPFTAFVIEVVDSRSVRIREVVLGYAIPTEGGEPYLSRFGKPLRVAEPGSVKVSEDGLVFRPHALHRLVLVDPLTAYVDHKALEKAVSELEKTIEDVTRLRAQTFARARYRARRRLAEYLRTLDEVYERLKEEALEEGEA